MQHLKAYFYIQHATSEGLLYIQHSTSEGLLYTTCNIWRLIVCNIQHLKAYCIYNIQHLKAYCTYNIQHLKAYCTYNIQHLKAYCIYNIQHLKAYCIHILSDNITALLSVRHHVQKTRKSRNSRNSTIHKILHCNLGPFVVHFLFTCDCLACYTWIHSSLENFVHRHIGKLVCINLFVVFLNLRRWIFFASVHCFFFTH